MAKISISITESIESDIAISYAISDEDAVRIIRANVALMGVETPEEAMQAIARRTISEMLQRTKQWEIAQVQEAAALAVPPINAEPIL